MEQPKQNAGFTIAPLASTPTWSALRSCTFDSPWSLPVTSTSSASSTTLDGCAAGGREGARRQEAGRQKADRAADSPAGSPAVTGATPLLAIMGPGLTGAGLLRRRQA
jgi:hypothetical protein